MGFKYDPRVFVCPSVEAAKAIILTPEQGLTTDERWERETAWLLPLLRFDMPGLVVDYGCGIGRIAKHLKNPVIGVDISPSMRFDAERYCARPDFCAVHPPAFDMLLQSGLRCSGGLAIWTLQHAAAPLEDIFLLRSALLPDAPLWVMNRNNRALPMSDEQGVCAWVDDEQRIAMMLTDNGFELERSYDVPLTLCAPGAWLRCYRRRA